MVFINLLLFLVAYFIKPPSVNYAIEEIPVNFAVPANFPQSIQEMVQQAITPAGFKLGRILFMLGYCRVIMLFPVRAAINSFPLLPM